MFTKYFFHFYQLWGAANRGCFWKKTIFKICKSQDNTLVEVPFQPFLRRALVTYMLSRGGRGVYTPLPLTLNFYIWYEVESRTNDSPWSKETIDDIITLATCLMFNLQPETVFGQSHVIKLIKLPINFTWKRVSLVYILII